MCIDGGGGRDGACDADEDGYREVLANTMPSSAFKCTFTCTSGLRRRSIGIATALLPAAGLLVASLSSPIFGPCCMSVASSVGTRANAKVGCGVVSSLGDGAARRAKAAEAEKASGAVGDLNIG